jgi:NitT/TauT family transport system substrate-binding protein
VTINDVLARNGVDPSSVRYVEMSFSAMPAALQAGRVDAIWANEPFLSSARLQGARVLFSNYEEYDPNLTVAMYFTSTAFAAQHPNAVLRFARAMDKAEAYAQSHPAETRRVLAQYTQLDAATASTIALAGWHAPISVGSIRKLEQSMIARKLLQGPVDINALLAPYRAAVGSRP